MVSSLVTGKLFFCLLIQFILYLIYYKYLSNSIEPLDLIRLSLDEQVFVKCRGNRELKGTLYAYDPHMNMVLGNVQEKYYEETSISSENDENKAPKMRKIEMLFLRGDLIILVKPAVKIGNTS